MKNFARVESAMYRSQGKRLFGPATFTVEQGECIGILGANGAGKSTLLNFLNTTLRPTSGAISLFEKNPWTLSEKERCLLRTKIGTVMQKCDYSSLAPFTVRDLLSMGRLGFHGCAARLDTAEKNAIQDLLEEFGLAALAEQPYRQLSGGEQQKAQIARAMVQSPDVLLLDEPTAGLDPDWQEKLILLIEALAADRSITLLITTHAVHHLPRCCSRLFLLKQGDIIFDGKRETALCNQLLSDLYNCPMEVLRHNNRSYCISKGDAL